LKIPVREEYTTRVYEKKKLRRLTHNIGEGIGH
jgi:hypothetical protein